MAALNKALLDTGIDTQVLDIDETVARRKETIAHAETGASFSFCTPASRNS